jgi:hypothetical protein
MGLVPAGGVKTRGPGQVHARRPRLTGLDIIGQYSTVDVINDREPTVAIAVRILRVLDQIGLRPARRIVEVPHANGQPLGHAIIAVGALPDPRRLALVVIGVVRRRIGQGLAEVIGLIEIGVLVSGWNGAQGRAWRWR